MEQPAAVHTGAAQSTQPSVGPVQPRQLAVGRAGGSGGTKTEMAVALSGGGAHPVGLTTPPLAAVEDEDEAEVEEEAEAEAEEEAEG